MLKPVSASRWNYATAAHLLNRAGFGGTPAEIEKLTALGPEKAIDSLLNFESIPDATQNPQWAKVDPDRFNKYKTMRDATPEQKQEMRREEQRSQRNELQELRQWWLERMARGPRPLQEKLVLFWHGHFATSAQKVKDSYLMWKQNEVFRRHGSSDWLTLLTEVSKDPAMLVWLDQAQSRKQHPNENFAREVMELFSLGEGHYTEKDITEAARAFTGWSYDRLNQDFIYRRNQHDDGPKTIFGKTGAFSGDDVLKLIVSQPQTSRFIARKLWTFFAAEKVSEGLIETLAVIFRANRLQFRPLLRAMFLSEEFYAPEVMRQQVKSPVQWLVSSVRMLERNLPPAQLSANALRQLGQDLLLPPNVKGWDGGLSWITTSNLLNRYNYAGYLVLGENPINTPKNPAGKKRRMRLRGANSVDVAAVFPESVRKDKNLLAAAVQKRLLHGELKPENQKTLQAYLDSQGELDDVDVLHALRLVMCTPEFQLC
ncbi:MAG TPA: DUF1800 domain-containing protein [Candidatus Kapabacteria bacterium]|nr:DUF1800 domain-containing protein [Candidatus Kapabacteria bacterium]